MNKKRSRLINRFWERWAITPENDIFASSSSPAPSAKTVKDVIRWHNKHKKCDIGDDNNESRKNIR